MSGWERKLRFPGPYRLRVAGPKDVICFPKENEVEVYLAFFDARLQFFLDNDLETILAFYALLLFRHSPTSICTMVVFLSLIRRAKVESLLNLFRCLF